MIFGSNLSTPRYNTTCSSNWDDYQNMVICQNNIIEIFEKCWSSCEDAFCQLECREKFFLAVDGKL